MLLRNRFLNTASFLSAPADPPGGKKPVADAVESMEDAGDGNDDTGANGGDTGGDDAGADQDGGDTGADGEDGAAGDDDDAGADEDDDPDLAGFTPEQRAKIQAKIDKETRWRDRQLERAHAKRRSAEEDVRAAAIITAKPGENLTQEQIEARARDLAGQMSAQDRYDEAANQTHAKGLKAYGDKWKKALDKLPRLGGVDLADMKEIVETDNPEVVLFTLTDPDEYERVMSLPPAKRRTEFIKIGLKEPPKRKTETKESKRPGDVTPPVKPVGGGRQVAAQQVNLYDPNLQDDAAWYAARNATRRKKFSDVA